VTLGTATLHSLLPGQATAFGGMTVILQPPERWMLLHTLARQRALLRPLTERVEGGSMIGCERAKCMCPCATGGGDDTFLFPFCL
jgi:hypothetical protein